MSNPLVLCIVGPTACGKNELALKLAEDRPVSVVNLDSRQVYKDFPIITAQPRGEERKVCPHHLYGFLETTDAIHAGRYVELANEVIAQVLEQQRLPVMVGGTGMYLRSLMQGLAPIPPIPEEVREEVLQELEEKGPQEMHQELAQVDPLTAARVHPNDRQRIARALEVERTTNRPMSWWRERNHKPPPYDFRPVGLAMEQEELNQRIEQRVEAMLETGALDEASRARENCDNPEAPGWTGIGCAELLAHLHGECSLDEAEARWIRNTKAYAKRQMTWFRKEPALEWLPALERVAALERVRELVEEPGPRRSVEGLQG